MSRDYGRRKNRAGRRPADTRPAGHPDKPISLWHHVGMATKDSSDALDALMADVMANLAAWTRAEQAASRRRTAFAKSVAAAIEGGVKPAALVRKTEKSAETIRQMAREHGVEPLRPPTVTSIRKLEALQGEQAAGPASATDG